MTTRARTRLDPETCRKLLLVPATVESLSEQPPELSVVRQGENQAVLKHVEERNARFADDEVLKLDRWPENRIPLATDLPLCGTGQLK